MKPLDWSARLSLPQADPLDFLPPLLSLQDKPPRPLGRTMLWAMSAFLAVLTLLAVLGRLDVVAVAEGKLVPQSYVKIVQPAEAGIIKEIRVREGDSVRAGEVLVRLDTLISEADTKSLDTELKRKQLTLRRIDAELADAPFQVAPTDSPLLAREIHAQFSANRSALEAALAEERSRLAKARQELAAAEQIRSKLEETLPHYRDLDSAFEKLARDGYAGAMMASDKRRERIEKEQELKTQEFLIESSRANIVQAERRLAQIAADYRRQLHAERNEVQGQVDRLEQEVAKQAHRQALMELRAPQDSIVKDLATHTTGAVVQPGTVLLSLVPKEEALRAEVWVSNEDVGFVRPGQPVKLKLAAFPFQKYGMLAGQVEHVSADAADDPANANPSRDASREAAPLMYKTLIALQAPRLQVDGAAYPLAPGMQTNAEIHLGERTVLEYLLSPVQKAWHEAARER